MEQLKQYASKIPYTDVIEQKTKLKREHQALILLIIAIILILSTPIGSFISTLVGVIMPLSETLTVLKKPQVQRHYVVFWMTFGLMSIFDSYCSFIVKLIPFYHTFKLFFLVYLGTERSGGSDIFYENVISKVPEKYYSNAHLGNMKKITGDVVTDVEKEARKVDAQKMKDQVNNAKEMAGNMKNEAGDKKDK